MFNSSINVRLKVLFDKMFLSRNIFEKMKNLINSVEEGSYSYNTLINRANQIITIVNNITDNIEGLIQYNNYIDQLKTANNNYNTSFDIIFNLLITKYTETFDMIINELENYHITNESGDRDYKSVTGAIPIPFELPETDEYGKFFIPTDDSNPWNIITKSKLLGVNDIIVFTDDYFKIDPKNEDNDSTYSGGIESKKLSRGSMMFDVLINVKESGFSLSTINNNTNEIYTRIEDDYEADISVGINDKYFDNVLIDENGFKTTKPKPGLALKIREFAEYDIAIRRHGEFSEAPTKFFISVK